MGAIGGIIGGIASAVGIGKGDAKRADQAKELAGQENLQMWKNVQIPTIEEQSLILQNPNLMGQYSPEQLQYMQMNKSAMESVHADPATINAQNEALRQLQDISKGGLTEADKSEARQINAGVNQQSQARQKAILNAMASRGTLGSGMELAAKLQGEQQDVNQASQAGENLTQQAQARALQALGQQGSLAGQIRGQQFNEQADVARARDAINAFNTQNQQNIMNQNTQEQNRAQQINLTAQQQQENNRANLANQQQVYNKGLYQTNFGNQVTKAGGVNNANNQFRGAQAGTAINNANREKGGATAIGNAIAAIYTGGASAAADEGTDKQNTSGYAKGGLVKKYVDGGPVDPNMSNPQMAQDFAQSTQLPTDTSAQSTPTDTQAPTPAQTQDPASAYQPQLPPIVDDRQTTLDPRYKAAVDESRKRQMYSDLLNAFNSSLEDPATGYKANKVGVDMLNRSAQQPLQDFAQLQAQDKEHTEKEKEQLSQAMGKQNLALGQTKLAESAVQADYSKKLADPTSQESQNLQDFTIHKNQQLGLNIPEENVRKLSGEQLSNTFPYLQKDYTNMVQQDQFKKTQDLKMKMLEETTATRRDIAQQNNDTKLAAQKEKEAQKQTDEDTKAGVKLSDALSKGWTARSGEAGKVQNRLDAADQADAVFKQGLNQEGGLDSRQIEELSRSVNNLISNGSNTASARIEALVPHTFLGKVQTLKEYLSNGPKGQEMQDFVDRLKETIDREREVAQNQKSQYQKEMIPAYAKLRKSNPDLFESILKSKGLNPAEFNEHGLYQKMILMKDPQGNIRPIPESLVEKAKKAGGSVVDEKGN